MDRRFLVLVLAAAAVTFAAVWLWTAPAQTGNPAAVVAEPAAPAPAMVTTMPASSGPPPAPPPPPPTYDPSDPGITRKLG